MRSLFFRCPTLVALAVAVVCAAGAHAAGLSIVPSPPAPDGGTLGGSLGDGGQAGCHHASGGAAFADHVSVNFRPGAIRDGECTTFCGVTVCTEDVCQAGLPGTWFTRIGSIAGSYACGGTDPLDPGDPGGGFDHQPANAPSLGTQTGNFIAATGGFPISVTVDLETGRVVGVAPVNSPPGVPTDSDNAGSDNVPGDVGGMPGRPY